MEVNDFADIGSILTADHLHKEHETVLTQRTDGLQSQVEVALSTYADSIEGLSAGCGSDVDRYTRGFITGLRAAIKVAANAIGT